MGAGTGATVGKILRPGGHDEGRHRPGDGPCGVRMTPGGGRGHGERADRGQRPGGRVGREGRILAGARRDGRFAGARTCCCGCRRAQLLSALENTTSRWS